MRRANGECANYSDAYVTLMIDTLAPVVKDLKAAGILHLAYIYGFDENPRTCEGQIRKLFGAAKMAFPGLRTAAALNWSPMPVDIPVDIWVLQYEMVNPVDASAWRAAGKVQWHYHCIEPHGTDSLNTFIERPAFMGRLLMWLAALNHLRYGVPTGWLYFDVNSWHPRNGTVKRPLIPSPDSPFVDFPVGNYEWYPTYTDIFANGDGQFIYPCAGGMPCASIRLAGLRDGLEDWDGLFFNMNTDEGVDLLQKVVRSAKDWNYPGRRIIEQIRQEAAMSMT